jgi:hypothetical protein
VFCLPNVPAAIKVGDTTFLMESYDAANGLGGTHFPDTALPARAAI